METKPIQFMNSMDKQQTLNRHCVPENSEPDAPNYTPRISGIMWESGTYSYALSILKSANGTSAACNRYTFAYNDCLPGEGRFLPTY